MLQPIRQTSFANGELDPKLYGRDDVDQYASGVRRMRNMFPTRHGAAASRAGTEFVRESGFTILPPVLVRFEFSDEIGFVVEVGHPVGTGGGYFRFHRNGQTVKTDGTLGKDGTPYELGHSYLPGELRDLKFAQLGQTLLITHPSHTPRMLRRVANNNWTLTAITFDLVPFDLGTPLGSVVGGLVEPMSVGPVPPIDSSHPALEWRWKVTGLIQRDGLRFETAAVDVTRGISAFGANPSNPRLGATVGLHGTNKRAVYRDRPYELDWVPAQLGLADPAGPGFVSNIPAGTRHLGNRVYRGRGGIFGLVGEVLGDPANAWNFPLTTGALGSGNTDPDELGSEGGSPGRFIDYGDAPDLTRPPPQGRNPFYVIDVASPSGRTEKPTSCCYFEQRLVFGGTPQRPEWLWFSRPNDFFNFDTFQVPTARDAVEFEIASLRHEEIRSLVPLDTLLVFTNASVWSARGAGGANISADQPQDVRIVSSAGASKLQPLALPGAVLYERAVGGGVRDLAFSEERGGYHSGDLTFLSQHLFEGRRIVSWAYAEVPFGVVWAVLDDGTMLSLTYDRGQGIVGWALHTTSGSFRSVAVLPEGDEDAVYVVVARTIGNDVRHYVERMTSRLETEPAEGVAMDSSIRFTSTGTTITGLTHLRGKEVVLVADGDELPRQTVTNDGEVTIDEAADVLHVGLPFTPLLETLNLAGWRTKQKNVKKVWIEHERTRGMFVGEPNGTLREWFQREVSGDYDPLELETDTAEVTIQASWNKHGRVVIEQRSPFFLTVLGVTREVDVGRG